MVDDLVLQGVTEPYRMLTARAEYRLRLRADNAAARLTPKAIAAGCVSTERAAPFRGRARASGRGSKRFCRRSGGRLADGCAIPETDADGADRSGSGARLGPARQFWRRRSRTIATRPMSRGSRPRSTRLRSDEAVRLPADLDYVALPGLSNEMVERLSRGAAGHAGRGRAHSRRHPGRAGRDPRPCPAQGRLMDEAGARGWVERELRCST